MFAQLKRVARASINFFKKHITNVVHFLNNKRLSKLIFYSGYIHVI